MAETYDYHYREPAPPDPEDYPEYYDFGLWEECWSCGGTGYRELYDDDPLWYDPDDIEKCDVCDGEGGWKMNDGSRDSFGKLRTGSSATPRKERGSAQDDGPVEQG